MDWPSYLVVGLCLGLWASSAVCFFRSRSALFDLVEEVNSKLPYAVRYSLYSMNPLIPFRVWRKHREFYPQDTGVRHRVKYNGTVYLASATAFTGIILVWIFVGH